MIHTITPTTPRLHASDLLDWRPISAALLLLINDHLFKPMHLLPGWLTGKLSDFAGLYCFPILLTVVVQIVGQRIGWIVSRKRIAQGCIGLTLLAFALLKTMEPLADWVSLTIGLVVCDPTDLVAFIVLPFAYNYLNLQVPYATTRLHVRAFAILLTAFACMATQPPPLRRGFAMWNLVDEKAPELPCGQLQAWVAKSSKEGVGITLMLRTKDAACTINVLQAMFSIHGESITAAVSLPLHAESHGDQKLIYVPFVFDNNRAWNRGWNEAVAKFQLEIGGTRISWEQKMVQDHEGYHIPLRRFEYPKYKDSPKKNRDRQKPAQSDSGTKP